MKEGNIGCPRRGCSYHIKCITTTFLAALMWRGPMNSVVLATTTHRKMRGMSDGTDTQVGVQMINKCKVLMTSRRFYKKGESP